MGRRYDTVSFLVITALPTNTFGVVTAIVRHGAACAGHQLTHGIPLYDAGSCAAAIGYVPAVWSASSMPMIGALLRSGCDEQVS